MSCYVTLEFYRRFKLITDPEIELNSRTNFLNVTFHGTIRRSASEMISHSYHIHTRKVQQKSSRSKNKIFELSKRFFLDSKYRSSVYQFATHSSVQFSIAIKKFNYTEYILDIQKSNNPQIRC